MAVVVLWHLLLLTIVQIDFEEDNCNGIITGIMPTVDDFYGQLTTLAESCKTYSSA